MGMIGRPCRAPPEGFEEVFVEHGWEARDLLGMRTSRFKRAVDEAGPDLKSRRRNYVLGRRLTSLKAKPKRV
jgi:hypothetical protein